MAGTGGDCRDGDQHARAPRATGGMTLVLVGKIGNGKSATGNSILGREAFASKRSFRSVTLECQKQSTTLGDGRIVNVIDTPGLLDTGVTAKNVGKEIFDFMGMPKDGIDAVLVVFSAVSRFSEEDTATIRSVLSSSLGERMILTFTHGDEVGKDEFKDMLKDASEYMTEMVKSCGCRVVLFDNRTKDTLIQEGQRKELFDKVDSIMINHQERPLAVQIHPNIKKEEGAGRVNVEEWKEQVEDDRIRGHSEIHKSSEENEVLKPWYVRTYKYCAYAAEQVWNKICCLWNKLVAIVTSRVKTTKTQVEVKIFFTSYYEAQRRLLRPKLMANYCR